SRPAIAVATVARATRHRHGGALWQQPARRWPQCGGARQGRSAFPRPPRSPLERLAAVIGGCVHQPHEQIAGQLPMIDLSRTVAMLIKEFVQLRRDRLTFSTMIFIPVVQLLLFGYAINTTPRHLPTAVLVHEENDLTRSVLAALGNTSYFSVTRIASSEAEMDHWMRSGDVLFGVEIPAGVGAGGVRGGRGRAWGGAADAGARGAAGAGRGAGEGIVQPAVVGARALPEPLQSVPAFEIRQHRRYNPAAVTSLNIVPGLLGT